MTPYLIFWQLLPYALISAGVRSGSDKFVDAIERLRKIEDGNDPSGVPAGQTGYLNGNNPYQALREYVAHIYGGAKAPDWLTSAERR